MLDRSDEALKDQGRNQSRDRGQPWKRPVETNDQPLSTAQIDCRPGRCSYSTRRIWLWERICL